MSRMASDTLSLYGGSSASFYDVKLVRSVKPVSVPVTNLSKKRTGRSLANTEARSVASQMTVKYTIMVSDGARIMMAPVTSGHWQVRVTYYDSILDGHLTCNYLASVLARDLLVRFLLKFVTGTLTGLTLRTSFTS